MKETIQKIIKFISPIPEKEWCINVRHNREGQHCILGHLESKKGFKEITKTESPKLWFFAGEIARANNGRKNNGSIHYTTNATKFDRFKSPKTRSIKFLESLLVNDGWKRYL